MKIGFIIPNLFPPGGNSVTVVKYIEEAAKKCEKVVLYQSYNFSNKPDYHMDRLMKISNVRVVTLKLGWYKLVEATRNLPYGYVLHYTFFPIFVYLRRTLNRRAFAYLDELDGIYSFDFVDSDIFPRYSPSIITGTHNQKMGPFKVWAINHGMLLKRSSGVRLFDNESKFVDQIKGKLVKVIPKGVNTSLFYPRDAGVNQKIIFLFVARLEPKKGLDTLLEAWKEADVSEKAELHIVGEGRLSGMITKSNIPGIVYHGALFDKPLQEMYRNSDVFVFPTEWDTQATVLVEAVSSGLFTLCSEQMRGVYDDFESLGFLRYFNNNVKNVSESIVNACNMNFDNFDARKKMHQMVEENRSQIREVDSILNFVKELREINGQYGIR